MSNNKGGSETEVFVTEVAPVFVVAEQPQNEVGSWKSGLCSCCKYGCCHSALLWGCCFSTILMGQVRVFVFSLKKTGQQIPVIECFTNNTVYSTY